VVRFALLQQGKPRCGGGYQMYAPPRWWLPNVCAAPLISGGCCYNHRCACPAAVCLNHSAAKGEPLLQSPKLLK